MTKPLDESPRLPLGKGPLGLIHTVGNLRGVFGPLAEELLPNVEVKHVVRQVSAQGRDRRRHSHIRDRGAPCNSRCGAFAIWRRHDHGNLFVDGPGG